VKDSLVPERPAPDPLAPESLTPEDRRSYAAAIAFADERHAGQLRKGTTEPYVVHPLEAAALLARYYPERRALVTAGFLHDTLEDTRTTSRELSDRFGPETARLVVAVTRRWWHAPWRLDVRDPDVVRLKAADCVSNIRATIVDLHRDGPSTWRRFAGGERAKRDYYRRLARAISAAIPGEPLAARLSELEAMLEAERPRS
jgi:(p)ppGpp synthase/HD superfamily hydrolase